MGIPRHKLLGEPTVYVVPKKRPFTITDELDEDCVFVLEGASLIPYDETVHKNICLAVFPQKEFVPSFDKSKEKTTLINMWASRNPAEDAKIKITAEINIKTGDVKVNGSGFEFVIIHMYRLNKDSKDVSKD